MSKENISSEKIISSGKITIVLGAALGLGTGYILKKNGFLGNTFPKASAGLLFSGITAYGLSNLVEKGLLDEKREHIFSRRVLRSSLIRYTGHFLIGYSLGLAASSLL